MKCNVGNGDRWARVIIGVLILGIGYYFKSWWGIIGLILIITGLLKWCPLYRPFGINTDKTDK